jgi:hypothetical protein
MRLIPRFPLINYQRAPRSGSLSRAPLAIFPVRAGARFQLGKVFVVDACMFDIAS